MRKELFIHLFFFIFVFLGITLLKAPWLYFEFLRFWSGGLVGTFLLDLDHLLYAFILRPYELTPQRSLRLFQQRRYWEGFSLLADAHRERTQLIAHTVSFQALFVILSFLVITSSVSTFGKGLVLGLFAHILLDQALDFQVIGDLRNWFWHIPRAGSRIHWTWFFGGILVFLFFVYLL